MRQIFILLFLLVFGAGCSTDHCVSGVYYVYGLEGAHYNPSTMDVIPLFSVEPPKPTVEDQGRAVLLGKWRVRINEDGIWYGSGGQAQSAPSQWELDEFEFRDDGTYSMRRVLKDGTTVLEDSGEDGRWSYADGVLCLSRECLIAPGMFFFSAPNRYAWPQQQGIDYRVKWHSKRLFTLEYVDPVKALKCKMRYMSDLRGHYDDNGCFCWQGSYSQEWPCHGGCKSAVNSPMRFKRVGKTIRQKGDKK